MFSDEYKLFRSTCALSKIRIVPDEIEWTYFDVGPKDVIPLVFLHGTSGTADVYWKQLQVLGKKGYRVISVHLPAYFTYDSWVVGFDRFLDTFKVSEIHLFGASLGGFLAQIYAGAYPRRVTSLILCNSFCDTTFYFKKSPCRSMFRMMPDFYLRNYIYQSFPQLPDPDPLINEAVVFAINRLESLSQQELASRLTLNCLKKVAPVLLLEDNRLTIIDTLDKTALPPPLREQLYARYPNARRAQLKTGGDFPFGSRPDEVNLYIQIHLKNNGLFPEAAHVITPLSRTIPVEEEKEEQD